MTKKLAKKVLGRKMPSIDNNHPNFGKLDNHAQYLYAMFHENILPTLASKLRPICNDQRR